MLKMERQMVRNVSDRIIAVVRMRNPIVFDKLYGSREGANEALLHVELSGVMLRIDVAGWVIAFDMSAGYGEEIFRAYVGAECGWKPENNFTWCKNRVESLLIPALDRELILDDLAEV